MHRRTLKALALTATLTVTLSLAACGGDDAGSSTDATTAKGPITIWYSNNEQEVAWGKAMVDSWNAAHADQLVEGQEIPAGKSSEEVIGAAITAGTAPCLVFNTAPSAVGQFQRQGGLVNLANFPDGAATSTERSGPVADQYKAPDGGFYQLPWKSNPVMIFYNKDLFKKAGLDPENPALSTYAEFLDAARKIKSSGRRRTRSTRRRPASSSRPSSTSCRCSRRRPRASRSSTDGKATFADPDGIEVATFWKTLYDEGLAGKETYQGDSFADKKAAMAIVGPWAISVYKDKVNWGSVPVPTKDGIAGGGDLDLQRRQERRPVLGLQEPGHRLGGAEVRHQRRAGWRLLDKTGQMPLRKDLQTAYPDYFTKNKDYQIFGDQAARTVEVPAGPQHRGDAADPAGRLHQDRDQRRR